MVNSLPAVQETRVWSLSQEDPPEKEMATHSSILVWKSHEWSSLAGCSRWGRKESDTTERLHFTECILGQGPVHRSHRVMKDSQSQEIHLRKHWESIEKTSLMASALFGLLKEKTLAMQVKIGILLRNLLCQWASKSYKHFHLIKLAYP